MIYFYNVQIPKDLLELELELELELYYLYND